MIFQHSDQVLDTVRDGFHRRRVVVVGDLMLDRYVWGTVDRVSPEAPVPVVRIDHRTHCGGGAANVAANLSSLGCATLLAGIVGNDDDGRQLLETVRSSGVEHGAVLSVPDRPTTCKTRILGGRQQMLRLDTENSRRIGSDLSRKFLAAAEAQIPGSSAVILSDYGKGLLDEFVCQGIIRRAHSLGVPVFVDPKGLCYEKYAGCDVISPNRSELAAAVSGPSGDLELLLNKGQLLRSELGVDALAVTLSELGIALLEADGIRRFPALAREVFDVSGAGDTVIATMAAGIAAGLRLRDAVQLANLAAGIVVSKLGTVPISQHELRAALAAASETSQADKICSLETLRERVALWRITGRRIVFTNGCFDLLHVGHLTLLEQAKRQGDCLVVALNTDRSVRSLKGAGRPVVSEQARAKLLAALPCVDAVVLFDKETPLELIEAVRPNVLVKGGNYLEGEVVGAREIKTWGGSVTLVPLVDGFSSAAMLRKVVAELGGDSPELIQ